MTDQSTDLRDEFVRCLGTMSHSRAGWDYELPREQRAREEREEKEALTRARAIWSEHPELHDSLLESFVETKPLATMREIENAK